MTRAANPYADEPQYLRLDDAVALAHSVVLTVMREQVPEEDFDEAKRRLVFRLQKQRPQSYPPIDFRRRKA